MNVSTRVATSRQTEQGPRGSLPSVQEIVEEAAHLLPEQAPLHAFVHHNTLHAFEHLSFDEAVVEAASVLGTEPFQQESEFTKFLETGRIRPRDIADVVADTTREGNDPIFPGGPTHTEFRRWRLQIQFEIPRGHALSFLLAERNASTRFHPSVPRRRRRDILDEMKAQTENSSIPQSQTGVLRDLWECLLSHAPAQSMDSKQGGRRRDDLLEATSTDTDELVHPLLVRLCAAFLDQGIAYWPMPDRSKGFLRAVRRLYGLPISGPGRTFRGITSQLYRQEQENWTAERTVVWALSELGVSPEKYPAYIKESLLALRGWAGMMRQLELRPDKAPVHPPRSSLLEFLAVRLVLDVFAAKSVLHDHFGEHASFETPNERRRDLAGLEGVADAQTDIELVYEAFVLAQRLPICWAALMKAKHARLWLQEVRELSSLQRRRLLQLALERRHRTEMLDGLQAHARAMRPHPPRASEVQAVFCIDDREESTRRHLEEASVQVRTYGYPGFFGVAAFFRSMDDHRPRPLCPVSIRPRHLIEEEPTVGHKYNHWHSTLLHHHHVGRLTLWRGMLIALLIGPFAMLPWIAAALLRGRAGRLLAPLRRRAESRIDFRHSGTFVDRLQKGFRIDEMAGIVESLLVQTGILKDGISPLVVLVGHGSSSVNNPHLAAYGCGATAGGCGGPNARVFAMMANDAEVRRVLAQRDVVIPETTHFVGAMHDTCKDSIEWFDVASVPAQLADVYGRFDAAFKRALVRNAKERTRLFGTVSLNATLGAAKWLVEARSMDLSEARPEYNHAKNSLCIFGPRDVTKGLFLDQRAFLVSYDSSEDENSLRLCQVLKGSLPVCAGINLEYLFSTVDPIRYGAGSKLPHNITGLLGVMDGHASDLRTGLYQQMVELHEPVRLTAIVIAESEQVSRALSLDAALRNLIDNQWLSLAVMDPETAGVSVYEKGKFRAYRAQVNTIGTAVDSLAACAATRSPVSPIAIRGEAA